MSRILDLTKLLSSQYINENSIIIDATCGNGHDVNYFAPLVKHVYAFDIQEEAINSAKELVSHDNVTFILDGHENINKHVSDNLDFVIFNLGYLPGSDKTITTNFPTTKQAIESSLDLLNSNGAIILVVYHGHDSGKAEASELDSYLEELNKYSFDVVKHQLVNKDNNPPYIYEVIKK